MSAPQVVAALSAAEVLAELVAGEAVPLNRAPIARPFPVAALGTTVGTMVAAVAEATQTDPGMPGALALGALAAAAGGRVRVRARPGWEEPCNLYTCPAAAPGTRKSAVFHPLLDPLREAERDLMKAKSADVVRKATEREVAQRQAEAALALAGKMNSPEETDAAVKAALDAEKIVVPAMPRLLADDATPEAMTSLLVEQGGRLAVVSAEGGIFDMLDGRYSKVPSLDVVLKGHAGDTMRVDRKGRPSEYVEAPALTLVLTVQPAVLEKIGRNRDFHGRGLLARLLCCLPPSTVGLRKIGAAPVPERVAQRYADAVRSLAVHLYDQPTTVLDLDGQAANLLHAAEVEHETRLGPAGSLAPIVEWASKAMGAALRVAGLLHLAEHGTAGLNRKITAATLGAALEVMAYFTDHALAVAEVMGADDGLEDARAVLRHGHALASAREDATVSQRDLHRALPRNHFPTADVVREALEVLREEGWAAEVPAEPKTGGRPPSPRWCFRPDPVVTQPAEPTQPPTGRGSVGATTGSVTPPRPLRLA